MRHHEIKMVFKGIWTPVFSFLNKKYDFNEKKKQWKKQDLKFCFKIPVFVAVARPVRFRYKTSVLSLYWLVMLLMKLSFLIQITIFYQYVLLLLLFLSILSLHNVMALRVVEYKIRKVFVYESTLGCANKDLRLF